MKRKMEDLIHDKFHPRAIASDTKMFSKSEPIIVKKVRVCCRESIKSEYLEEHEYDVKYDFTPIDSVKKVTVVNLICDDVDRATKTETKDEKPVTVKKENEIMVAIKVEDEDEQI